MSRLRIRNRVWLTRWAGQAGDPSLRLKNGYAQDDAAVWETETLAEIGGLNESRVRSL